MNKRFFILQLKGDVYTIYPNKSMDYENSKMTADIQKITNTKWSCTNKQKLIEFAQQHKEEAMENLKIKLEKAKNRQILCKNI